MSVRIQWRRDTAADWSAANPTLASGEPGKETDTGKWKMGDGVTAWADLSYQAGDEAALSVSFARTKTLSALDTPFIVPHKGGGSFVVPEHTDTAYAYGLAHGFDILDMDARTMGDGSLVDLHDETIDAMTTTTGNVSEHTAATIGLLDVDAGTWLAPGWPNNLRIGLIGDRFARYGTNVIHLVEAKAASTTQVQAIIDLARSHAVEGSLVIQAANLSALAPAVDAGIPANFVDLAGETSAATIVAAGVGAVTVSLDSVADAVVSAYVAAGLDVWAWTDGHYNYDRAVSLGCAAIIADDPVYMKGHKDGTYGYRRTSDAFALRVHDAGMLTSKNDRGKFIGTDRYGWDLAGTESIILLGNFCPVVATTYTIDFSITFDEVGGSSTASAGLFICEADDRPQKYQSGLYRDGYYVNLNQAGTLAISKIDATANTSTQLGGVAGTGAPTAGTKATIRCVVSPTDIKINRVDGSVNTVYTTTDTAFRGGYIHMGQIGLGSSLKTSFSDITIT